MGPTPRSREIVGSVGAYDTPGGLKHRIESGRCLLVPELAEEKIVSGVHYSSEGLGRRTEREVSRGSGQGRIQRPCSLRGSVGRTPSTEASPGLRVTGDNARSRQQDHRLDAAEARGLRAAGAPLGARIEHPRRGGSAGEMRRSAAAAIVSTNRSRWQTDISIGPARLVLLGQGHARPSWPQVGDPSSLAGPGCPFIRRLLP
jgi:hypothetical protein